MIESQRFALNRITCPGLSIPELFALARELDMGSVELRNDLGDGRVCDELTPHEVRDAAAEAGVGIFSINALQKFNLAAVHERVLDELDELAALARELGCASIVLCPNNDTEDHRPAGQMYEETVAALLAMRPIFEQHSLIGLVEPLGFAECSLRSAREALRAVDAAGGDCFKLVHDTFHFHLGPDDADLLDDDAYMTRVGLIHLSGVDADVPVEQMRDPHRVLVSEEDRLHSRGQVHRLCLAGYAGPISLEPFAVEVQALERGALKQALAASINSMR